MRRVREPYESDAVDIGFTLGSVVTLNDGDGEEPKKKSPLGFAPSKRKRMKGGGRRPGSWPKVPWLS